MSKRNGTKRSNDSRTTLGVSGATKVSKQQSTAGTSRRGNTGRSGGVVDAPGKKHRQPLPTDPGANIADSQAAKLRTAKTMQKTGRLRGRG